MKCACKPLFLLVIAVRLGIAAGMANAFPTFFFENSGEFNSEIRFIVNTPELRAGFASDSVTFEVHGGRARLRFRGASPMVAVEGEGQTGGRVNFLVGSDPRKWRTASTFERIVYRELYRGIDLIYSAAGAKIKSEFHVAPNGDPREIQLEYPNADRVAIGADDGLEVTEGGAMLHERAPEIYQESRSGRIRVEGRYRRIDADTVGFAIGRYDPSKPLIIDPVVSYATYLGGNGLGAVNGIAVDASGNVYLAGWTEAVNFPIQGAVQSANGGGDDAFVVKLSANGSALIYATYIGGSSADSAAGIAVDSLGQAYVTGYTTSSNFPLAAPVQSTLGGGRDAFVLKLNAAGSQLVYSTYFGGTNWDQGTAIAVDASGNAYIAGDTQSANLPVLSAVQSTFGGQTDAFVAKFTPAGAVSYSTFLGGSATEHAGGIAVDSSGNVYVGGGTTSSNFPVMNAMQAANGGGQDAFLAKLNPSGSTLGYSTYMGGNGSSDSLEQINAVAVDSSGDAYVAGVTNSTNFPVTSGAIRAVYNGMQDAFAAEFSTAGALVYSSYLGGSTSNWAAGIALDAGRNAYVAGATSSVDFPLVNPTQAIFGGDYDAFLSQINASGTTLIYSTYYGGSASDGANAIAVDTAGNIYAAGETASPDFPLVAAMETVFQTSTGFVLRMMPALPEPTVVSPGAGSAAVQTFTFTFTDPAGFADLNVLDVLINNYLDGEQACYIAFVAASATSGYWYLVDDAGDGNYASGSPMVVPSSSSIHNSQCTVYGSGSSVVSSGNTLTLTLPIAFSATFAGDRIFYMAARSKTLNSGWQALGTWNVPGAAPSGPGVAGMNPARSSGTGQMYTFTFTDTNGYRDLAVLDILTNSFLDGIAACYLAYAPTSATTGYLYLVDNAGDGGYAGGSPMAIGSSGQLQNSQCTINAAASSASASGNTLTLNLAMTFSSSFAGNQIFYVAARNGSTGNSGWQAAGSVTVP